MLADDKHDSEPKGTIRMTSNQLKVYLLPTTQMKRNLLLAGCLMIALVFNQCKVSRPAAGAGKTLTAAIETNGLLSCCDPGTMLAGKPVWCEASAVLFDKGLVYVANDKEMPAGLSSVFTKPFAQFGDSSLRVTPLLAEEFINGRKYEDFASNKDYIFLTTAFDRVKPGSTEWDAYNTILYWKKGDEAHPKVLSAEKGAKNSVAYRTQLSRVLAKNYPDFAATGVPYFKIEGLAVMDSLLLFGIREEGQTFEKFDYRVQIVAVPFFVEKTAGGERLVLKDSWRIVADFDPKTVDGLPGPQALSSLEYDRARNRFWILTSVESQGKLDGYLWTATPDEMLNNRPFTLVKDAQGVPIHFGHKAEDITPLAGNRLLVIHDDDRMTTTVNNQQRRPNQAAYTILTIN